jgi:hypothetical protein
MTGRSYLICVDASTSSCKATLIDSGGRTVAKVQKAYRTHYPRAGWAEQHPRLVSGTRPGGPRVYRHGGIRAFIGERRITVDLLDTFGCRAAVAIPGLQRLLHYICKNGYQHYAAMSASRPAAIPAAAFETYLGWDVYHRDV